jgi:hypothetical protein
MPITYNSLHLPVFHHQGVHALLVRLLETNSLDHHLMLAYSAVTNVAVVDDNLAQAVHAIQS